MNRRQKKKRYKKIHGHNPPRNEHVEVEVPIDINEALERVIIAARRAGEAIAMCFENCRRAILLGMENIKTMPEEEFKERLQHLSIEQQAIALKIRNGANSEIR